MWTNVIMVALPHLLLFPSSLFFLNSFLKLIQPSFKFISLRVDLLVTELWALEVRGAAESSTKTLRNASEGTQSSQYNHWGNRNAFARRRSDCQKCIAENTAIK